MRNLAILDLDGTLAHTAPDLIGTLNKVTEPHDIRPMDLRDINQIVGHGAKAMIAQAFKVAQKSLNEELHDDLLAQFLDHYANNLTNETKLFEGVEAALDKLEKNGWSFAVCTNKKHAMAVPLLDQLGVGERFLAITGGDSFEFRKPDPRHLVETSRLSGCNIDQAIMIGDSETDINAAINAKIPSVAVTFGYSGIPPHMLGASAVIDHFDELPEQLEKLRR